MIRDRSMLGFRLGWAEQILADAVERNLDVTDVHYRVGYLQQAVISALAEVRAVRELLDGAE